MTLESICEYIKGMENIHFNFNPQEEAIYLVCDSLKSTDPDDSATLEVRIEDGLIILSSRNTDQDVYEEFRDESALKSHLKNY